MATPKLGLPTISDNLTADVVRDMNALAEAVDDRAGMAGGLATLGADGKVPTNQLNVSTLATKVEVGEAVTTHEGKSATTSAKGHVQLSSEVNSDDETKAATPKAVKTINDSITSHKNDNVTHITAGERTTWNSKETPDGARKKVEQTEYKVYKSNKDANGIFTTVEHKRNDGTLAVKAVLSGGTSPKYTTRTHTYYGLDGSTVEKTTTRILSYDADDVLVSEV